MAEEVEQESTGKSFKGIIITLVSTVTLGVGGFITNKLTGGDDKEAAPVQQAAPVINITNSNQQSQAAGGKTVIIKEKVAEPAKPVAPVKKKEGDEFKEKPAQW
jgi:outer membrane scaffolding protein for murein synthesis (MipA/OmpV family)